MDSDLEEENSSTSSYSLESDNSSQSDTTDSADSKSVNSELTDDELEPSNCLITLDLQGYVAPVLDLIIRTFKSPRANIERLINAYDEEYKALSKSQPNRAYEYRPASFVKATLARDDLTLLDFFIGEDAVRLFGQEAVFECGKEIINYCSASKRLTASSERQLQVLKYLWSSNEFPKSCLEKEQVFTAFCLIPIDGDVSPACLKLAIDILKDLDKTYIPKVLMRVIESNNQELIEWIIDDDTEAINRSMSSERGNTLLHKACEQKRSKIVNLILDNYSSHVDPSVTNNAGDIAFHIALSNGFLITTIKKFAKLRPSPIWMINRSNGMTPLHYALMGRCFRVVEYLVSECKVDVLAEDKSGRNALFLMTYHEAGPKMTKDLKEIVRLLVPSILKRTGAFFCYDPKLIFGLCRYAEKQAAEGVDSFLFDECLTEFYGPEVNSKYHLIERTKRLFPSKNLYLNHRSADYNEYGLYPPPGSYGQRIHNSVGQIFPYLHDFMEGSEETNSNLMFALKRLWRLAFKSTNTAKHFLTLVLELWPYIGRNDMVHDLFVPIPSAQISNFAPKYFKILDSLLRLYEKDLSVAFRKLLVPYKLKYIGYTSIPLNQLLSTKFFVVFMTFSLGFETLLREIHTDYLAKEEICEAMKHYLPPDVYYKNSQKREVLSLKHLSRVTIRQTLEKDCGTNVWAFINKIEELPLPERVKNQIKFVDELPKP